MHFGGQLPERMLKDGRDGKEMCENIQFGIQFLLETMHLVC